MTEITTADLIVLFSLAVFASCSVACASIGAVRARRRRRKPKLYLVRGTASAPRARARTALVRGARGSRHVRIALLSPVDSQSAPVVQWEAPRAVRNESSSPR